VTAGERAYVERALGADVARVTAELTAKATRAGWRDLLRLLHEQHSEVMESGLGQRTTFAMMRRIYGDASVRLNAGSEPGRGRFN
jgi:hypothetical protein